MRGRAALVRVAVLLAVACGACATLEGLDQYQSDGTGRADASTSPPAPEAGVAADDAGDSGTSASEVDAADAVAVDAPVGSAPDASEASAVMTIDGGSTCTCVGAAPAGWQGYVQLAWGDAGASSCASPYGVAQSHFVASVGDAGAECSACACSVPPSGPIVCEVQLGSGGALCIGEALTVAPQGLCVLPPGPVGVTSGPNGDSYGPTTVTPPVGTCTPSGGAATRPPLQTTAATVCAVADAGASAECGSAGNVCVPTPAPSSAISSTNVCIYRSGVQTCPEGFPDTHVVSTGVTDGRGCSACTCAAPACPRDGYVNGYASPNCTGNVATTFGADSGCTLGDNANLSVSFMYNPTHGAWNGTCAPSGGAPTGQAALDPSNATTFCCLP